MIDKDYCMSSYLTLRYVERQNMNFCNAIEYKRPQINNSDLIHIKSVADLDDAMERQMRIIKNRYEKIGVMLSGGMDSAIVASYLRNMDAYTFRFLGGAFQKDELERAEIFAELNQMELHYVDIGWREIESIIDWVMENKGGPVHSIEPQIYLAAAQAQKDGEQIILIGDGADYVFGGMDKLLSKDWTFDEFMERYTYVDPQKVLKKPYDMSYIFEKYRTPDGIDFISFLNVVATEESYGSYENAFSAAGMDYYDPFAHMILDGGIDLQRIRGGNSKYLVRELFRNRYSDIDVPEKNPMPRPVEQYFEFWKGPYRSEFREDIDISSFSGNQKWLIWCLERFLNKWIPE